MNRGNKKTKKKAFVLVSGREGGLYWNVICVVKGDGTSGGKGMFTIQSQQTKPEKRVSLSSGNEGRFWWSVGFKLKGNGAFCTKSSIEIQDTGSTEAKERVAKRHAKSRGLGFHKISFGFEGCMWHHVNWLNVVAMSPEIHHADVCRRAINHNKIEGVLG